MFYRRKVLLALFQVFEFELEKLKLQKLLFLFCKSQNNPTYDFIPYKYGCFSFSANADLTTMSLRGILTETESKFTCNAHSDYLLTLQESDRLKLLYIKDKFGKLERNDLIKYTYLNHPYWAINSIMAENILSNIELKKIKDTLSTSSELTLFTIGYEGISLESYFNKLIQNNIKTLIDVRNNPLSMKYGFSKNQLIKTCTSLNIEYIHIPEVGIKSEKRKNLVSQSDYDTLFNNYKTTTLSESKSSQNKILNLLKENKRVAMTCFEANICQCHRKVLSENIQSLSDINIPIHHL